MKLKKILGAIEELNQLAENPEIDQNSPEVLTSNLYTILQTTTALDASYLAHHLTSAAFILLVKIAASAPILHTLDITCNRLYMFDYNDITILAASIAKSPSLHTINIQRNYLEDRAFVFVEAIIESAALRTIDIRWNSLHGINKENIIALIEARNQNMVEWQKAFKFLSTIAGSGLNVEGEIVSAIGEVAFSTHDSYAIQGNPIEYYVYDCCVIG